uniref:Uncharacterized protein n=1 Tax=Setaria digitata TaxID=48799 RepID=A0A915Q6E3_9BILA
MRFECLLDGGADGDEYIRGRKAVIDADMDKKLWRAMPMPESFSKTAAYININDRVASDNYLLYGIADRSTFGVISWTVSKKLSLNSNSSQLASDGIID